MATNRAEIAVGAVVLAAALAFVIYAAQTAGIGNTGGYPLGASFRSLEGVSVGTDVRLAGVKIGTVAEVTLNPETYRADTVLVLRDGVLIPDDSAAVIESEGLLGGNFVNIAPGGSFDNFAAGDTFSDTQGAVSLISLLLKFVSGGSE